MTTETPQDPRSLNNRISELEAKLEAAEALVSRKDEALRSILAKSASDYDERDPFGEIEAIAQTALVLTPAMKGTST